MSFPPATLRGPRSDLSVRPASERAAMLPVCTPLAELLPDGGLRRGFTVQIDGGRIDGGRAEGRQAGHGRGGGGACTLLLSLLAAPSRAGSWCAVVGAPFLGMVAAEEAGVDLARLALVRAPGTRWAKAVAALLDGFDLVAVHPPPGLAAAEARTLSGRARHHKAVLVSLGAWPGAQIRLGPISSTWTGLGDGHGYLSTRHLAVQATGRGAAGGPPRRAELILPAGGPVATSKMPAAPGVPVDLVVAAGRRAG